MPHSACLKMLTTSRGCFSATRLDGFEKNRELQQIGKERLVVCGDRAADYLFIPRDWNGINLGMYQSGEWDKKGNSTFWIGNLLWTMCTRVPWALSPAGVGGWGWGAETTSLAMRRVLHLWEETPVILSQKIWTASSSYRRFEGDWNRLKRSWGFYFRGYKINRGEVKFTNTEKYATWDIFPFLGSACVFAARIFIRI